MYRKQNEINENNEKIYKFILQKLKDRRLKNVGVENLYESVEYHFENKGKMLRPKIMLSAAKDFKGNFDDIKPFAAAVEMIHNYSLIHDDLPAMDNDDYRRGKLTVHKKYGEATAILAGDFLLNLAFETLMQESKNVSVEKEKYIKACAYLSEKSCDFGMLGGQILDIGKKDTKTLEGIFKMYEYKTAALFETCFVVPGILSNICENLTSLEECGKKFGLIFQMLDDLQDEKKDLEKGNATILKFHKKREVLDILKSYSDELISELEKYELYNLLDTVKPYLEKIR